MKGFFAVLMLAGVLFAEPSDKDFERARGALHFAGGSLIVVGALETMGVAFLAASTTFPKNKGMYEQFAYINIGLGAMYLIFTGRELLTFEF